MNIFKKGIAALAFAAMSLAIMPTASAMSFTDANEIPSWANEAIEELSAMGVIDGNADGSFAPAKQLNRAEVSKIIVLSSGVDIDTYGGPNFPDVDEDAWYYDYIETMYNYGWVNGYPDGMFRPGNGINRAEIAKMVVNALELDMDTSGAPHFDDVDVSDWFFEYVETAYNYDLMRGYADGTFGPTKAVTRAETAKIVYDGLLVTTSPSGPAEGTLEVSLSMQTPRGTNVPYNATSVPYTTVELTASDDSDVEISSLTFTRLGLGDNDDFNSIWMEIDGFKVGNDKSINNDDIVELRFNPPVVVPAGQTLVADVVASAKYTESDKNIGHHNRLAVVSASDVASTAVNVVGDFPIEGEEMEVADYQVSMIEFSSLGSDATIDVGDNFIEIGKFRMLNESNSNKDIELRAVTFKNEGTAELENVLENVALYVSGEQVSAESIIDGDYVTFRLDNGVTGGYILEDGDSRIFSMRADIVSAEKSDTIQFKVDNYEDIVAIEIGTSFGVKAVDSANNNAEDSYATLKTYSIDSGDVNISRDPSSLGNQQYAPGSNDVVAMTARMIVDQPLLVDGITITASFDGTANATGTATTSLAGANAAFSNFRLFLNDSLIDSENTMVAASTPAIQVAKLSYDTTFEITGASILKLVMNIQDGAPTGSWIKFNVVATDLSSPEYISTGDQVASTELLGSAQGSKVEVTKSDLTITKTDGFSAETIVAGLDDVTFMEFVLDNNDSGDVNVTSVSLTATATGAASTFENFTAAIFVDGTQQGSSKNLSNSGTATFNDLSVVIPSAAQKEFAVVVNTLEASSDGTLPADTLKLTVSAVDADNVENGQTVTGIGSVAGATFTLVQSGSLVQSIGSTVYSDILVAGTKDVSVLKIRFNAADDSVQIKDLYLKNNAGTSFGPRADFKLYNEAGQLIQTKQMQTGDTLHFELANQDRIAVPKDNSTFITVKVDVRDITSASMTGKKLQLTLDNTLGVETAVASGVYTGVDALTAATGTDLVEGSVAGTYVGEPFVAYRTQLSIKHAATQPHFQDPSAAAQEVYRFTVTADAARQAELGKASFNVALSGMSAHASNAGTFTLKLVKNDGTIDNTASVASVAGTIATSATSGTAVVSFTNQKLSAGESRTFALFLDNTIDSSSTSDDDAVSTTIVVDTAYALPNTLALAGQGCSDGASLTSAACTAGNVSAANQIDTVVIGGTIEVGDIYNVIINGTTFSFTATATTIANVHAGLIAAINAGAEPVTAAGTSPNLTLTADVAGTAFVATANVPGTGTVAETVAISTTTPNVVAIAETWSSVAGNIIWSDESSNAHSDTTLDWLNGYLLDTDTTAKVIAD